MIGKSIECIWRTSNTRRSCLHKLETSEYSKRLMKRLEDAEDLLALILSLMKNAVLVDDNVI